MYVSLALLVTWLEPGGGSSRDADGIQGKRREPSTACPPVIHNPSRAFSQNLDNQNITRSRPGGALLPTPPVEVLSFDLGRPTLN
jgi:hypothetical protein